MEVLPKGSSGEKMARGTFAAILAASRGACDCDACKILKSIAGELQAEFTKS